MTTKKPFKSLFEYYEFTKRDEKEYPVISRILKSLTPKRIEKEIKAIQKVKLPPELMKWVREYEKVGERDEFIWKWLYYAYHEVFFPIVPSKYQQTLPKIKVLLIIFVSLLDDTADKKQNKYLLNILLKIPFEKESLNFYSPNPTENNKVNFAIKLWKYLQKKFIELPNYKKFKEIFYYDIIQLLNAMRYSYLINQNPYLINNEEYQIYLPHNMTAIICCDIDLMSSSRIDFKELSTIRKIIWYAQKMARIGNWISTWERELKEDDFTSAVIASAIDSEILTVNELKKKDKSVVIRKIKNSKIEKNLLKEWEQYYCKIEKFQKKIKRVNIKKFLYRLERFITLHLISRGYK